MPLPQCEPEDTQAYVAALHFPRAVRFEQVSDDFDDQKSTTKTLHILRHGQGFHNAAKDTWVQNGKVGLRPDSYENRHTHAHLIDAKLTERGEREALALVPKLAATSTTLCVVSPLRRSYRTLIVGMGLANGTGEEKENLDRKCPRMVVNELVRECFKKHFLCDQRRDRSQVQEEASNLCHIDEFHWIPNSGDSDALYAAGGESHAVITERCYRFLVWLFTQDEDEIAIGAHSHINYALLNSSVHVQDPELLSWFATGEMRSLRVKCVGDAHAEWAKIYQLPLDTSTTLPMSA